MSTIYVPNTCHKLISVSRIILALPPEVRVTYDHVNHVKSLFFKLIYEDLYSAREIAELYDIKHSDFGMFIKKSLGIKLLSKKERSSLVKTNDLKTQYWKECSFSFNVYDFNFIPGYDLLANHSWYSKYNRAGIQRDHMVSIKFGWEHNIPPSIISHPANCHIMLARDNTKKGESCSISINELIRRIDNWDQMPHSTINPDPTRPYRSKTNSHKSNISKALSGRVCYNDKISNIWINPNNGEIPDPSWTKGRMKKDSTNWPIGA